MVLNWVLSLKISGWAFQGFGSVLKEAFLETLPMLEGYVTLVPKFDWNSEIGCSQKRCLSSIGIDKYERQEKAQGCLLG